MRMRWPILLALTPGAVVHAGDSAPTPDLLAFADDHDAASAARLALGRVMPGMPLSELLRDDGAPARLFSASEVQRCEGSPWDPAPLRGHLRAAEESLFQMEYDAAYGVLSRLVAQLPCASARVDTETLSGLYLDLGVAASHSDAPDFALRWFSQSLAVQPERKFDETHPPIVFLQYLRAMERHYASRPVPLRVLHGDGEVVEVLLDGRQLDPEKPPAISEGFHFLQLQAAGGALTTLQFRVQDGDRPVIATAGGLAAAAARPEKQDDPVRAALTDALRRALAGRQAEAVQIVSGLSLWHFEGKAGEWELLRGPPDRITKARTAGRVLLAGGLVTMGSSLAVGVTSYAVGKGYHPAQPEYQGPWLANLGAGLFGLGGAFVTTIGVPLLIATQPVKPRPLPLPRRPKKEAP
jgi:hypothetical protein